MSKKKATVCVGIPTYNEGQNIIYLLRALLIQKETNYKIKKIVVISDGSTDNTVSAAQSVKDPLIRVINQKVRRGLNSTQNKITKLIKEDVLIIVNGDVIPDGKYFIHNLILPILQDKDVGLVSADVINAKPVNVFESMMANSLLMKNFLYAKINLGNNIYKCHGQARAFSKAFYSNLIWPGDCPEDAYSYLNCIKKGFKFIYAGKAKVTLRLPQNIKDHAKQSLRFIEGKKSLNKYFSLDLLRQEYYIPIILIFVNIAMFLVHKPILTIAYLLTNSYIWFIYPRQPIDQSKWDISTSSKKVV